MCVSVKRWKCSVSLSANGRAYIAKKPILNAIEINWNGAKGESKKMKSISKKKKNDHKLKIKTIEKNTPILILNLKKITIEKSMRAHNEIATSSFSQSSIISMPHKYKLQNIVGKDTGWIGERVYMHKRTHTHIHTNNEACQVGSPMYMARTPAVANIKVMCIAYKLCWITKKRRWSEWVGAREREWEIF